VVSSPRRSTVIDSRSRSATTVCVTDVYGFEDLPLPLREIVETENRLGEFTWAGPDGCTWRVWAAFV